MKDPILKIVADLAESEAAIETEITLVAGGFLISGKVVSAERFFSSHPITERVMAEAQYAEGGRSRDETSGEENEIGYIHLSGAKYYTPNQYPIPGNTGVLCRLAIDTIAGFNFGRLEIEEVKWDQ